MNNFPLQSFNSYIDFSDEIVVVMDYIEQNDVSNPGAVVKSKIDWSDEGYTTDGEPLDGTPTEAFPNGRASLVFNEWYGDNPKRYVQVFVSGAGTTAKGIPFRFSAQNHTVASLVFNVPRLADVVTDCSAVFIRPDGTQPGVAHVQLAVQSN